ncbi:MAG: hypothetical protein RMK57_16405 [Bryobacterales bacterium]|nr:hypothetical protein [Bryobacteraceae bacterium]MDW8356105.1 hypothetical protein [Bryobacterales bacterium]
MNAEMNLLAEHRGFGRVFICPSLQHVYVAAGPVTICLETRAFRQFVVMLNESASNLELLLQDCEGEDWPSGAPYPSGQSPS